ncbi:MAG: hypothetical protein GXP36_12720 [Actinobacteria bacterium]|nr:hypothetical protein [Actinomycetota bacterium]
MQWQYHVEEFSMADRWSKKRAADELQRFNDRLNQMGSDGWEMISYETVSLYGAFSQNLKGTTYLLFWKRQA